MSDGLPGKIESMGFGEPGKHSLVPTLGRSAALHNAHFHWDCLSDSSRRPENSAVDTSTAT